MLLVCILNQVLILFCQVTPAMVHALLKECRTTRSARHLKKPKARTETTSREERGETGDITEEELKTEEGEGKEREGKMETEVRERERRERDRRGWEREDRMRRDKEREERSWRDRERREGDRWEWERRGRERRDEDKWEWERRDRERRDRRRMYDQGSPEWRSYSRYEMNRRSSWKDEDFMSEDRKVRSFVRTFTPSKADFNPNPKGDNERSVFTTLLL